MLNWDKGISTIVKCYLVDNERWTDTEEINIASGKIDRTKEGLLESARLELRESVSQEAWIRVYLAAQQEGGGELVPVFTGLATAPKSTRGQVGKTVSTECYSVLKAADDVLLKRGFYAPAGADARLAASLIGKANVRVEVAQGTPRLQESIVADDGETNLSMARKIVDAIGWRMRVSGEGVVYLEPLPAHPSITFGSSFDVIEQGIEDSQDTFTLPNCLRVSDGSNYAEYKDADAIAARGREVWAEEGDVNLAACENLYSYAKRRLKTLQNPTRELSYNRRFIPNVGVGDVVEIDYPNASITGLFEIASQSIDLENFGKTKEEVEVWQ